MGKRKREKENEKVMRRYDKKIRKLEEKLKNLTKPVAGTEETPDLDAIEVEENYQLSPEPNANEVVQNVADLLQPQSEALLGISEQQESEIDSQILDVLGAVVSEVQEGPTLHNELSTRWNAILKKGLSKEQKQELSKQYPLFENVQMAPPTLNAEVSAAVTDAVKKRDAIIAERQKQIGVALTCLGMALQSAILNEDKLKIIQNLNDSAKLICDCIHIDTKSRRGLITAVINKELKQTILQTEPGKYLFGENMSEQIKTAKAVHRSGQDLKGSVSQQKPKETLTTPPERRPPMKTLNWRGPPRPGGRNAGGQRRQDKTRPAYNQNKPAAGLKPPPRARH